MPKKLNDEFTDFLFDAIVTLQTREECAAFFKDLCTIPEVKSMSQRLVVAKMLKDNMVYSEIVSKTGASTATISRVNRSLNYENSGGYDLVFERMEDKK
ncbi:MAG: TrpR YerC/YecD [Ruminococcus sp.]|nr:TrpR YerC/YecD [Ruminococcus sp.]MBQ7134451.1 TrpR YerC/YecD [Ruminococcus sp.]